MMHIIVTQSLRIPGLILLMVLIHSHAWSQVVVERSKEKAVIEGVAYYIHHVSKGETVYSISRAYGISTEELVKENPSAAGGINMDQVLRIPVRPVSPLPEVKKNTQAEHDDARFIYHALRAGETVYSLSKTYNVTVTEIINSNPGIDITKLSVGLEIAIPRRAPETEQHKLTEPSAGIGETVKKTADERTKAVAPLTVQEKPKAVAKQMQPQEKGYFYHKVEEGESLSSIARHYGLTVREIRKANRNLRFPQVGDYVRVPGEKKPEEIVKPPVSDTLLKLEENPVTYYGRPAGFTPVNNLSGTLNVAVMLPFYLAENSNREEGDSVKVKGKYVPKITKRNEDWIYPRSLDFLEMYEGILLAADTLRSMGLSINLHAFDIGGDSAQLIRIIRTGKLMDMDLIIGPVYSSNLAIVADYAKEAKIPVVSPVPLFDNAVLDNNPELFLASSTLDVAQHAIARELAQYYDNKFIFIHTDSISVQEDAMKFRSMILTELGRKILPEEIRFRDFLYYSKAMFDNDSINRLSNVLSDTSGNIVVIASEDPPVISEIIIDVHSLSKRYNVRIFGYPVMRDLNNLDPKYFFDLDQLIYTPYWIDYSKNNVMRFNTAFRQKFLTEPVEKSYAWQGYDIAYYFLSGLALFGKEFVRHPEIHRPELLATDFDFLKKTEDDGFENHHLFLIRYTKDYEVQLKEGEDSFQEH
jgi:LysM repeat protein